MSICRCLFWKYEDETAVVALSSNGLEPLKFLGKVFCSYTDDFKDFWSEWKQQISYESTQEIDFCVISDGSLSIPKELLKKQCGISQSEWRPETISNALATLDPHHCVTVRTYSGYKIADLTAMFTHEEPSELIADFTAASEYLSIPKKPRKGTLISENDISEPEPFSVAEATPLVREFLAQLDNDKKRRIN